MMRTTAIALLILALAGCSSTEIRREPVQWQAHQQQLAVLQHWIASGKLAFRNSETADSAQLQWFQRGKDTDLQLSGPLGVGTTLIHSDGRRLEIRRGDEFLSLDISTPEAILLNTGYDLPLQALTHWLKGIPAPDSAPSAMEFNPESGLLQSFRQDGWDVHYEQYGEFDDFTLPRRMRISRDSTEAKVIISQWRTAPA